MRLAGKICIITGSGHGQGRAAALLFAKEGAKLVLNGRHEEPLKEVAEEIRLQGGTASYFAADTSVEEQVQALVKFCADTYGRLDIMYNNGGSCRFGPIHLTSTEDFDYTMKNELYNVFFGCKYAVLQMLQQNPPGGTIINTASVMGQRAYPGSLAHAASKAGVIAITRSMARDYGRYGIRCNAISPGFIGTEYGTAPLVQNEQFVNFVKMSQVIDDIGKPEDVVHAALFLASDEARFLHGEVIEVDGGTFSSVVGGAVMGEVSQAGAE